MQDTEITALKYFSDRIRKAVLGAVQSSGCILSCITIRKNGTVSVVIDGKNVLCGIQATHEDMDYTLDKLCKGSLYAYGAASSQRTADFVQVYAEQRLRKKESS